MKKLYLNMPVSEYYGWGICGKNLLMEFHKKVDVKYIENGFTCSVRMPETIELVRKLKSEPQNVDVPFIHATMPDFSPSIRNKGKPNIGYAFYENFTMPDDYVENAKKHYDILAGGSVWNKELFESYGINSVAIRQGVDRKIFYPDDTAKDDRFIVFSGGKFEQRKAQDLVVKAVVEVQKKYPDIYLLVMWHNIFDLDNSKDEIKRILKESGVKNLIFLGLYPQGIEAQIMRSTSIGIFPNKCEGGTNLVLMEYLACGNPVIARYDTGQRDVLNEDYALMANELDEIVNCLEFAYNNREKLKEMGRCADLAMNNFSLERTANEFLRIAYG